MELAIPKGRKTATRHTRPGIHGPNRRLQGEWLESVIVPLRSRLKVKGSRFSQCGRCSSVDARRTAQRTPADAAESSSCWVQTRRVELDAWNQRVLHGWPPLLNWRMLCYEVESSSKEIWRPSEDVENRKRFQVADSSRAYTSTECQDYIRRITLSVSYFIHTGNK